MIKEIVRTKKLGKQFRIYIPQEMYTFWEQQFGVMPRKFELQMDEQTGRIEVIPLDFERGQHAQKR